MMWLFDPEIAKYRTKYSLVLRFQLNATHSRLATRTGWTIKTESPEVFPLSASEPATIVLEYMNSRSKLSYKHVPVDGLTTKDPSPGDRLLVIAGEKKGLIVKYISAVQDTIKVKPKDGNDVFGISKQEVCLLDA